jgi:hypothetical protein
LLGNGDGTFASAKSYSASANGGSSIFVLAADFNGDGVLDLAVLNQAVNIDGDLSILIGNGDGSFQPPVSYAAGGPTPQWAAVGDFNGDQKIDIAVVIATTDTLAILLGNGDGTFQAPATYAVESSPQGLAVADFNHDGQLDIAVANECGKDLGCRKGTVSVLLGNGDGTFGQQVTFAAGLLPLQVEVADFNRDGNPDLAISLPCGSDGACGTNGGVGILLGKGDGTFTPVVDYVGGGSLTVRLALGDLDGDSRTDVIGLNYETATVTLFRGDGKGKLKAGPTYSVGGNPISGIVRDLNGDGAADFAVSSQTSNGIDVFIRNR